MSDFVCRIPPFHTRSDDGGGIDPDSKSSSAARKRLGRPPGSKNKPKQPVVDDEWVRYVTLLFTNGSDIIEGIRSFSSQRKLVVSILSITGSVSNISFLSIKSAFSLPSYHEARFLLGTLSPPPPGDCGTVDGKLCIAVKGPEGKLIAGTVAGPLVAAGPIILTAACFARSEQYTPAAAVGVKREEEEDMS